MKLNMDCNHLMIIRFTRLTAVRPNSEAAQNLLHVLGQEATKNAKRAMTAMQAPLSPNNDVSVLTVIYTYTCFGLIRGVRDAHGGDVGPKRGTKTLLTWHVSQIARFVTRATFVADTNFLSWRQHKCF